MQSWRFVAAAAVVGIVTIIAAGSGAQAPAHEGITLRAIMAEMGGEYLRIIDGILRDDYDQAAEAAATIAHHPMPEAVVGAVKGVLASDFAEFDRIDEAAHQAATAVHDAAVRRDGQAAGRAASALLSACVECHSRFRTRLRPLSD